MSQYVDYYINPLVRKTWSYVKDSRHMLEIMSNIRLTNKSIMVTLDVSALYTNIPHDKGLQALTTVLK